MSSQRKDIDQAVMVICYQGIACFPSPLSTPPRGKWAGCISKTAVTFTFWPLAPLDADCVIVRRRLRSPNRGDEDVADAQHNLAC
jgi:hypothetical protein